MSAPHHNDGPFVKDSRGPGLLRRLLGGGTHDPSSPHNHSADTSTSQMHDEPLSPTPRTTPVAEPGPFGIPRAGAPTGSFGGGGIGGSGGTITGGGGTGLAILKWLRPRYDEHHGVKLTDGAVESAVRLGARYITERNLPV